MSEVVAQTVLYCAVCTYPPEYCEFGLSARKCREWLQENHADLAAKYYSADALANITSTLSLEKEQKITEDLAKKQIKEEAKQERELRKKLALKVIIKRIERNKRKHIISVSGLEVFNIDMKKLAKTFASKFATGASVTKNAEKKEEIMVQGDVSETAKVYIEKLLEDQGLHEVKVECIDDKKKKKDATPVVPA